LNIRKAKLFLSFKLRHFLRLIITKISGFISIFKRMRLALGLLSIMEKRIIIICTIVFLVALGFLVRKIYLKNSYLVPAVGGKISIAEVGEPKLLNPLFAKSSEDKDVVNLVYSGLFYWDNNLVLKPDLAKKWVISEDRKTYTFALNEVNWHDNMPVTSEDIAFTASVISDQQYAGPLKGLFDNVTVEPVDDKTIKFTLAEPYQPFLKRLTFGILPAHVLGNVPTDQLEEDNFNLSPVGSGPYMVQKTKLIGNTKQVILERVATSKNRDSFISEITINYFKDFEGAAKAYQKGEVSVLTNIPVEEFKEISKNRDLNLYHLKAASYMVLFFNLTSDNLKQKSIRVAIAESINKNAIIDEVLSGNAEPVEGPILPGFLGYSEQMKAVKYDFQKAEKDLAQIGFKKNDLGILTKNGKVLEFNLALTDDEVSMATAEKIKAQLAEVGIKANVIQADLLTLQTDYIFNRKFDMLLFGENLGPDSDPYPFWHSSQIGTTKLNFSGFSNKEVDKLLEQARTTSDKKLRQKNYQRFQQIIIDDVPVIFIFRPDSLLAVNSKVKGVEENNLISSSDKLFQLKNWYLKMGRKKNK